MPRAGGSHSKGDGRVLECIVMPQQRAFGERGDGSTPRAPRGNEMLQSKIRCEDVQVSGIVCCAGVHLMKGDGKV